MSLYGVKTGSYFQLTKGQKGMYFRFMVANGALLCFILVLSVNHKQFPSMQLPQKSKHNDSAFKKWMQILAGENSSRATTERPVSNKPRSRENIALFSEEAVDKRQERLQRLQTCTDSCNWGIFSLPLYSIQFNTF